MLRLFIAAGVLVAGGAAGAQETTTLTGDVIKQTFPGAVLEVDAPFGAKLPVRYGEDGLMSGQAGSLAFFLGSASDRGRWWVDGDKLCHKWFRWFDAEPQCLTLRISGNRIQWRRDDGETGTATIASRSDPGFGQAPYALGLPQAPLPKTEVADVAGVSPEGVTDTAKTAGESAKSENPTPRIADVSHHDAKTGQHKVPEKRAPAGNSAHGARREHAAKAAATTAPQPGAQKPAKLAMASVVPAARASMAPASTASPKPAAPRSAAPEMPNSVMSTLERSFRVANVEPDDVLNVRGGPSADEAVVGAILSAGRGVKIAGPCQAEWCPIEHRGLKGWVNSYYLSEERTPGLSAWPAHTTSNVR